MAKLRGDDDLFLLMNELSSQQGYGENQKSEIDEAKQEQQPQQPRIRLVKEVEGYGGATVRPKPTAIWNPYVRIEAVENHSSCVESRIAPSTTGPTNPHAEVFRRRAYEKFKAEFQLVFVRTHANATKRSASHLWGKLGVIGLMERWHFDAKLQEYLARRTTTASAPPAQQKKEQKLEWSTSDVQRHIAMAGDKWYDPILVTPPTHDQVKKKKEAHISDARFPTIKFPSENPFLEEVKFEWTRVWRNQAGGKHQDSTVVSEVFQSKKFRNQTAGARRAIHRACHAAMEAFQSSLQRQVQQEATAQSRKRKRGNALPKLEHRDEDVLVSFCGLSFSINREHFEKLQILFDRQNSESASREDHYAGFVSSVFSVLCRYDMLQGAGLQAAVHGQVFDFLLQEFDCKMECFASPLNCRYERYCSAFPDTDAAFGSSGSFFDFDFSRDGGCYQANPPFCANFIYAMCRNMEHYLEHNEKPIMFIIFVPAWKDAPGWKALKGSSFLSKHELLKETSHYYTEGTQHRRKKSQFRVASFDTSVFFLQSSHQKWEITKDRVQKLREAFCKNPEETKVKQDTKDRPVDVVANAIKISSKIPIVVEDESSDIIRVEETRPTEPKKKRIKKKKKKRKQMTDDTDHQMDILNSIM